MSLPFVILVILIICLFILIFFLFMKGKKGNGINRLPFLIQANYRKITSDEYQIICDYLKYTNSEQILIKTKEATIRKLFDFPKRNAWVSTGCNAITRFSLINDQDNLWRYFIDSKEVHLPLQLEPYLTTQNVMDVVDTDTLPLVISVNNHFLGDFKQNFKEFHLTKEITFPPVNAIIQESGQQLVKFIKVRKETLEEYKFNRSFSLWGGGVICVGLIVCALSLFAITIFFPWLMLFGGLTFIIGVYLLYRPYIFRKRYQQDIRCVVGKPKRWGLFGEFDKGKKHNISLAGIDLIYPSHWEPFLEYEIDQAINIDMYANGYVVRQGRYLSLHEEARRYPYKRYGKNLMLVITSFFLMLLLHFYEPVHLPARLIFHWLNGENYLQTTNYAELEVMPLQIGDYIAVKGVGMCYVPIDFIEKGNRFDFLPFDCSGIYWNNINPSPIPESDIVEKVFSLSTTVKQQLYFNNLDRKVNQQLRREIMKSGMNLLDNFADIILKTNSLCPLNNECFRLKSALVNLSDTYEWSVLVTRAKNGKLAGTNVILRPGGAETLEKLVNETTSFYINREIEKAAALLNRPPTRGVLLISDEGKPFVDLVSFHSPVVDSYSPLQKWQELQKLSDILMHTPFEAEGIITKLFVDAKGTRHIILHSKPSSMLLLRYISAFLLNLVLMATFIFNLILVITRKRINKWRLKSIRQYYEHCFNIVSSTDQQKNI
ncbi:IgaA/UmoB family intracellular growth attenuator [Arsenophonus sp.]|uniref:IgaA/UmoB family intracellular growth attenuator n=1 Tax=Arsenophonus sp. TaxID=1872640 RepID=UPI002866B9CD|nr:IgaA/UmoB family intracellular growth attenuator [Arsenophonus sp.]MDR5617411.1 IgaA/UmoB family intracellular growth attenuator [Arsenophonus sp.]